MRAKLLLMLVAGLVIGLLTAFSGAFSGHYDQTKASAQQQKVPRRWEKMSPILEADEPQDVSLKATRKAKNRRYNSTRSSEILTGQPNAETIMGRINEKRRPPSLPISESDIVILCTVEAAQPYFTENRKAIYTEFSVNVDEVFKNATSVSVVPGAFLIVDQEGGALRRRDGSTIKYFVANTNELPQLKARYVLFLSQVNEGNDLMILTGYELRSDGVISLEENATACLSNCDEASFLSKLRDLVRRSS